MAEVASPTMPLTLAQRGLWVGHKIAAADASMNIAEALEIRGRLDVPLLLRAMQRLADDLEAARVQIIERDGTPIQRVREHYHGTLPCLDFSAAESPMDEARRWMLSRCVAPVDLARDPLWQSALLQLGEAHFLWYQQAHHVIYDGFSGGLAARRIAEIYTAMASDQAVPDSGFGAYAELVEADRAYRDSTRFGRDRSFWLEQLQGLPEAVSLSRHGRRRSSGGLRRGINHLAPGQVQQLAAWGRAHGASLPQALITLVAAYYHRATGAEDLVIGMPVTGRVSAAQRSVPGMMANAVAIRLHFQPQDSATDLLQQVARVVRQALRHQQYRYEDVRRDLGLLGADQHMAWLGVNIEPFDYRLDFAGAEAVPMNLSNGSVEDLTVFFYERGDGRELRFDFDANPALYSQLELDRHAARLRQLASCLLQDPAQPLSRLELLLPQERTQVLQDWCGQPRPPQHRSLPAQIAAQAAKRPHAIAIRFRDSELSYAELQTAVETMASLLDARGIQSGDRVAVALPRGPLLLASLLAVLRLGAAYVPLDLDSPEERTAWVLADAAPRLLLAADGEHLPAHGLPCLQLPPSLSEIALALNADRLPPPERVDPAAIAYVLYTSGSTGRPKGVAVSQANLLSFLESMQQELELAPAHRFLAQTTLIFDIAGLELYLPLLSGACVVLAETMDVHDPRRLAAIIASQGVSHIQATPTVWRLLLSVRGLVLDGIHALVGGEALGTELAAELWRRAARLTQLYGPTETTIWSTIQPICELPREAPPIGRPLANTRVYVLDADGQPVFPGVPGELYIGGYGVAQGYVGRPELNAQRFVTDPFVAAGGLMYRSGDRVRWLDDGRLEFIGRVDQQVKIRGHRVEPGEIEHQLERFPAVAMAAVTAHRDGHGELALAGYVTLHEGQRVDPEALLRELARHVPAYMLPTSLQVLEAMPMTANRKLDRKALPAPQQRVRPGQRTPPQGALEQRLATLWQEVLGLETIGRHDNFFELGGDSLTAARMMMQLSEQFGSELSLASLFDAATIAGLAARLQDQGALLDDPLAPVLCLRRGEGRTPLFCIHPVVGIGWGYATLLRHLDPALPVYALQADGLRDSRLLPESLEAMAAGYVARIREIQPQGPYRLLGWSLGGLLAQSMTAQLQQQGQRVELLALMDAYPFVDAASGLDEAAEAEAALAFLGVPAEAGRSTPWTMQALAEHLCAFYGLEQLPLVQRLQQEDPDLLPRVAAAVRHHLQLARRHIPPRITGRAIYFQAAASAGAEVARVLHYRPSAWQDYIQDGLELHSLACSHQAMLDPAHAQTLATILGPALDLQPPAATAVTGAGTSHDVLYA